MGAPIDTSNSGPKLVHPARRLPTAACANRGEPSTSSQSWPPPLAVGHRPCVLVLAWRALG
eukprot:9420567-Alexandrium_andersonii.AAC.1